LKTKHIDHSAVMPDELFQVSGNPDLRAVNRQKNTVK
jgi:hypothetical protein